MNNHSDDEMFDDLHEGVEALREIAQTESLYLSDRAVATLERLESTVPEARNRLRLWKQKLTDSAIRVARQADNAAHQHPWCFTISALGLGLLTGLLLIGSGSDEADAAKSD